MDTLHLYPSALARDAALETLPDAAWTGRHLTFAEFIAELDRLLPLAKGGTLRREVRGPGRLALLLRAAKSERTLERIAGSERAVSAAETLLSAWKSAALRPDDVRGAAELLASNAATRRAARTVERLALLYERYEKELGKNWTDREGAERELLARLAACEKIPARLLPAGARVELHAFHRLAYVQFWIVERLVGLKHTIVIDSPAFSGNAGRALFGDLVAHVKSDGFPPKGGTTNAATRIEAPSPYSEVYEIGRRVVRWITEEKIAPREIGIAFRDLGQYSQAIHDVFKRLGIPFYERRGEPAQFQPLVRVALSAIDACVNGLDRKSVLRFVCAGPVDVAALAGKGGTRDASVLKEVALDAGIDRAYGDADPVEYWEKRLERFKRSPVENARQIVSFGKERAARALEAIVRKLNAMRVERSARAHAQAWRALFDECGLSVARIAGELNAARDQNETAALFKQRLALTALEAALEEVSQIPRAETGKMSIESFAQLLTLAVQEQSVRADGMDRSGVRVLNFYDVRGLRFKRLVIGGMAEGLCPARPGPDPLLGQGSERALREALSARVSDRDAGAFLAPRLSHEIEAEERALFESALTAAEGALLLTRPLANFDGGALGASEYWDEFSGNIESAAPIQPAPQLSECLTAEESELRAAWVLGSGNTLAESVVSSRGNKVDERILALRAYDSAPRLKALARRAAVEKARYDYFLSQSVAAARSERAPEETFVPQQAGAYDGVLSAANALNPAEAATQIAAGVLQRLTPRDGSGPVLSPSALEELGQCPFYFFAKRVCGFAESQELGEEISPLDSGSLWHDVLSKFYEERLKEAKELGHLTAQLDSKRREEYLKHLQLLAGEQITQTKLQKFTGRAGFWEVHEARTRALLATWLECELRGQADGFFVARTELTFDEGQEETNAPALMLPLTGTAKDATALRIRGRIDRIDYKTEMRDGVETIVALRVIDYKQGRRKSYEEKTKVKSIERLLATQLPLYLAAAIGHVRQLQSAGKIAADMESIQLNSRAGYYSLRDTPVGGEPEKSYLAVIEEWPLSSMRAFLDPDTPQSLFDVARRRVLEILSGNFSVQPEECAGLRCPARYACRFQAIPAMGEDE